MIITRGVTTREPTLYKSYTSAYVRMANTFYAIESGRARTSASLGEIAPRNYSSGVIHFTELLINYTVLIADDRDPEVRPGDQAVASEGDPIVTSDTVIRGQSGRNRPTIAIYRSLIFFLAIGLTLKICQFDCGCHWSPLS